MRKPKRKPAEIVTPEQFALIMRHLDQPTQHDVRSAAIIASMYYAGLRKGEVIDLLIHRLVLDADHPRIEVRESKGGHGRNVPIDPRLIPYLDAWLAIRPDSEWLFCTYVQRPNNGISKGAPPGSQMSVNSVWQHVSIAKKRARITSRLHPHMFRHAAATNWLAQGFNVREVQYLLGHANLKTTQRYLHVHDGEIAGKMRALGMPGVRTSIKTAADLTRACDWCAETIKAAARICRYCNRDQEHAA